MQTKKRQGVAAGSAHICGVASLLIGNGFSRSYNNDLFGYKALRDDAPFSRRIESVFTRLETTDFEEVMRRLDESEDLLREYPSTSNVRSQIVNDRDAVRTAFISSIHAHHPIGGQVLTSREIDRCEAFLKPFDRIFTTNYDLLLYWVILDRLRTQFTDGFRGNPISWSTSNPQTVYYLHGALHLWDDGSSVRKLTASRETIGDQVEERINDGQYPLFVSEGSSKQKLSSIRTSPYLNHSLQALASIDDALVVYGFSFSRQDAHIANAIVKSTARDLMVTYHGNKDTVAVQDFKDRCRSIKHRMDSRQGSTVNLRFRNAATEFSWR